MKTALKFLLGTLVTLLILAGIAEAGARWLVTRQITESITQSAPEGVEPDDPEVSFGPSPIILAAVTGTLKQVDLDIPSTLSVTTGENPSMEGSPAAQLKMDDLHVKNNTAGHLDVSTVMPDDALLATIQHGMTEKQQNTDDSGLQGLLQQVVTVTDLTSNEQDNSIEVEFTNGAATVTLTPTSSGDGHVSLEATNTHLFGFEMPEELTNAISDALQEGIEDQTTESGHLGVQNMEVVPDGLKIDLSGDNVDLEQLQQSSELD